MALINCPECGREISDKAEKCVHCGCPSEVLLRETDLRPPDVFRVPVEGNAVLQTQQPAETSETETKKSGLKFTRKTAIISIVFILVIGAAAVFIGSGIKDKNGYFRNTKWGMTMEEVEAIEEAEIYRGGDSIWYEGILDNYGLEGIETDVHYYFDDNGRLDHASIDVRDTDETGKINTPEFRQNLVDSYKKLFGDAFYESPDGSVWETDKSRIWISLYSDLITIGYYEINAFKQDISKIEN